MVLVLKHNTFFQSIITTRLPKPKLYYHIATEKSSVFDEKIAKKGDLNIRFFVRRVFSDIRLHRAAGEQHLLRGSVGDARLGKAVVILEDAHGVGRGASVVSIRIPGADVSMADLTIRLEKPASYDEISDLLDGLELTDERAELLDLADLALG